MFAWPIQWSNIGIHLQVEEGNWLHNMQFIFHMSTVTHILYIINWGTYTNDDDDDLHAVQTNFSWAISPTLLNEKFSNVFSFSHWLSAISLLLSCKFAAKLFWLNTRTPKSFDVPHIFWFIKNLHVAKSTDQYVITLFIYPLDIIDYFLLLAVVSSLSAWKVHLLSFPWQIRTLCASSFPCLHAIWAMWESDVYIFLFCLIPFRY